jgi:hypothetical protein
MASSIEVTERQKNHLYALLIIKKDNEGIEVKSLQSMINYAIASMSNEDIAWVEKITGVKALD